MFQGGQQKGIYAMANPKANAMTFKRGCRKSGGRQIGTPNRSTRLLREAVLLAAAAAGSEKGRNGLFLFLKKNAKKQPAIFMPVLARLLPLQVESQQTSGEVRGRIAKCENC